MNAFSHGAWPAEREEGTALDSICGRFVCAYAEIPTSCITRLERTI